jgi:hypothetical protein
MNESGFAFVPDMARSWDVAPASEYAVAHTHRAALCLFPRGMPRLETGHRARRKRGVDNAGRHRVAEAIKAPAYFKRPAVHDMLSGSLSGYCQGWLLLLLTLMS